jgi:hypothetical protein
MLDPSPEVQFLGSQMTMDFNANAQLSLCDWIVLPKHWMRCSSEGPFCRSEAGLVLFALGDISRLLILDQAQHEMLTLSTEPQSHENQEIKWLHVI